MDNTESKTDCLMQIVYCSTAKTGLSKQDLDLLLVGAKRRNADSEITGMLLYENDSFFQVLEGRRSRVEALFEKIKRDDRHRDVTVILRQRIANREFGDWSMGLANLTREEKSTILADDSMKGFDLRKSRKLLEAFRQGRWRGSIERQRHETLSEKTFVASAEFPCASAQKPVTDGGYSYAFQPIVRASDQSIFSYEALIRGPGNSPAAEVLNNVPEGERGRFDEESRLTAIQLAAHLGLNTYLNLNVMPSALLASRSAVTSIIDAIERFGINPNQIVLEILESDIIKDLQELSVALRECRRYGLHLAIDDFGAGQAGLNMLAAFQPEILKLDRELITSIDSIGPKQAITRGIRRTCTDLGIEIIAEGVETEAELLWLRDEGIDLFQGYLFAKPAYEELVSSIIAPA